MPDSHVDLADALREGTRTKERPPNIFDILDVTDVEELRFALRVCIDAGWQSKKRAVLKQWLDTQLALKEREMTRSA